MEIRIGRKVFDRDQLATAISTSKSVPKVCKAIGMAYSPTADYAIQEAAKQAGFDMSHFKARRERTGRTLGEVHPDTRSAIEGYLSTITRPDSLAAYKYLLYNIGESLNGESIIGIDKEGIEKAISLLKSDNQRKYAVSCVKSMLLHALKTNPKSRFTMRKSLLFWMLGIE
jgi:hypothetical protein